MRAPPFSAKLGSVARYEVADGTSHKFWEITLAGKTFTVRWGKLGSRGQSLVKHFASDAAARREYDKLVKEKRRKGYQLVDGTEEAEVAAPPAAGPIATASRSPELEAAVIEDPNDEGALMVLGDWLQTQGDPRGELISLQHALRQEKDPQKFLERKRTTDEHYKRHEPALLGELYPFRHLFKLEWQIGYIRGAKLSLHTAREDDPGLAELLGHLVSVPAAVALQELALGHAKDQPATGRYQDVLDAMASLGKPAALRTLVLGEFWPGTREPPQPGSLGTLAPLAGFAQLRRLVLHGGPARFDELVLPELRHFEVRAYVDNAVYRWLGVDHCPNLEHLALHYAMPAGLDRLLHARRFPKLRMLRLLRGQAELMLDVLADSTLLPQLEMLDLADGDMRDEAATRLVDRWSAFRHLKTFRLGQQSLSYAAVKRLRQHTTVVVNDPSRYANVRE